MKKGLIKFNAKTGQRYSEIGEPYVFLNFKFFM